MLENWALKIVKFRNMKFHDFVKKDNKVKN